jgi:CHAT domain-containing protein
VVASLWAIPDKLGTKELMVAFHRKLRDGCPKDEALRQAMMSVRRDPKTAHPYYWAAFVLTGDPENPNLADRTIKPERGSPRRASVRARR